MGMTRISLANRGPRSLHLKGPATVITESRSVLPLEAPKVKIMGENWKGLETDIHSSGQCISFTAAFPPQMAAAISSMGTTPVVAQPALLLVSLFLQWPRSLQRGGSLPGTPGASVQQETPSPPAAWKNKDHIHFTNIYWPPAEGRQTWALAVRGVPTGL